MRIHYLSKGNGDDKNYENLQIIVDSKGTKTHILEQFSSNNKNIS